MPVQSVICLIFHTLYDSALWRLAHVSLAASGLIPYRISRGKGHPITGHPGPRGGVEV
jgi:hypothetical protein